MQNHECKPMNAEPWFCINRNNQQYHKFGRLTLGLGGDQRPHMQAVHIKVCF